jgi:prevent-host-death family protein
MAASSVTQLEGSLEGRPDGIVEGIVQVASIGQRPGGDLGSHPRTASEGEGMELKVSLNELLPIKEASRSLASAVERLEREEAEQLVITKRSKPSAVIIALDRYEALLRSQSERPAT